MGIQDVFREENLSKILKLLARGFNNSAVQLLQNGAEPNVLLWGKKTTLHRAVENHHIALTETMIIHGVKVTAEHLIEAAHSGNHHLL